MSDVKEIVNGLINSLKKQGLDILEDQSEKAALAVFEWLEELAKNSENKIDDVLVGFVLGWKETILENIDKIDGEVDKKEEVEKL